MDLPIQEFTPLKSPVEVLHDLYRVERAKFFDADYSVCMSRDERGETDL